MTFYPAPVPKPETVIYREIAIGLDAFNRFKHWQRYLSRKEDQHYTNGEVLDRMILALPAPDVPDTYRRKA